MDILSLSVGFITGAFTGAAGNYLADRFTDARRAKKALAQENAVWRDIENRFPALVAEMRSDFSTPEGKDVRAFFLKTSGTSIGIASEPFFEYHFDKHPGLRAAALYLAQHGFVTDITEAISTPMFRIHEKLVDRLTGPNNSFKPKPLRGSA